MIISLSELHRLTLKALIAHGASEDQATATARALVKAEAQGLASHGVARVPMYCAHIRHQRVLPQATPAIIKEQAATALIDAGEGFAFPACELAVATAINKAKEVGNGLSLVTNSHHFGATGLLLEPVAEAGMVGIAMGNSPAAIPFVGGKRPILGTNPLAAIFPREENYPVLIDLSMTEVARGKIMVAARENQPIPQGWALDRNGNPTSDAKEALQGSMLPIGASTGVKGFMLALWIELMVVSLSGSQFGAEADSFFQNEGNAPRIGQLFWVINPQGLTGSQAYHQRLEAIMGAILADGKPRLPGTRRFDLAREAETKGVKITPSLFGEIRLLAGEGA